MAIEIKDYTLPYSGYGNQPFQAFTPTGVYTIAAGDSLAVEFGVTVAIRAASDATYQIEFTDGTTDTRNSTLLAGRPIGIGRGISSLIFPSETVVEVMGGPGVRTPAPSPAWILATGVWNDAGVWVDTETWNDATP